MWGGSGKLASKFRDAQCMSKKRSQSGSWMYESQEKLELQNINLGIISRKMSFKAVALDDIIKTEYRWRGNRS